MDIGKNILTNIILILLIILTIGAFIMLFGDDFGIHVNLGSPASTEASSGEVSSLEEPGEQYIPEEPVATSRAVDRYRDSMSFDYKVSGDIIRNPYIGYAPDADTGEDDGIDMNKVSLVYIQVTWREFEPQEGQYDFETLEGKFNIDKWKSSGKNAVLRFVCDVPDEAPHRDIPDWLYEKTGDGADYSIPFGKGYCPNYGNEYFIEAHNKAIRALGDYCSKDSFVRYVELGSLGHWGEWHIYDEGHNSLPQMPLRDIRQVYVDAYTSSFPNAKLLMRRPFQELPDGAGLYNDMVGALEDTGEWLEWIRQGGDYNITGESDGLKATPDIWNYAPVGGEFTSSINMNDMLTGGLEETRELIRSSHMSFIGPKIPEPEEVSGSALNNGERLLNDIGYRYSVSNMTMAGDDQRSVIELTITNKGTVPIYWSHPVCMYLVDENGERTRYVLDIDLTGITQDAFSTCELELPISFKALRRYNILIGIEDPEKNLPSIIFDNMLPMQEKCSILY